MRSPPSRPWRSMSLRWVRWCAATSPACRRSARERSCPATLWRSPVGGVYFVASYTSVGLYIIIPFAVCQFFKKKKLWPFHSSTLKTLKRKMSVCMCMSVCEALVELIFPYLNSVRFSSSFENSNSFGFCATLLFFLGWKLKKCIFTLKVLMDSSQIKHPSLFSN